MHKKVLVVVAHPDDEVLGCGGTIAKHIDNGDIVSVLILADGETSREAKDIESKVLTRQNAAKAANQVLGVEDLVVCEYPDNRLDTIPLLTLVQEIEVCLNLGTPEIIYTHNSKDVNIDHRVVHDAVIAAVRPEPNKRVKEIYFFEIPSSTEYRPTTSANPFAPNYFVDIAKFLDKKVLSLTEYKSELRDFPHPRSIEAIKCLAKWRGASVGVYAAEAFEVGRIIK